jgi:hypothetical protein
MRWSEADFKVVMVTDPQMAVEALWAGYGWLMGLSEEPTIAFDLEKYSGDKDAVERLAIALQALGAELGQRAEKLTKAAGVVLPKLDEDDEEEAP